MSYTDCDYSTLSIVRDRKAKKQHHCCECSALILVGEKYVYCIGKWDTFQVYKQHELCADACRWIRDQIFDDCIAFGSLKECFKDEIKDSDRNRSEIKQIRKMMADIFRRERKKI